MTSPFLENRQEVTIGNFVIPVVYTNPSPIERWFTAEGFVIFMTAMHSSFGQIIYAIQNESSSSFMKYFAQVSDNLYVILTAHGVKETQTLRARVAVMEVVKTLREQHGFDWTTLIKKVSE